MTRRSSLIPGLILIAIGGWFLAGNLGVRLPDITALWPLLPLVGGLSSLIDYFRTGRRDSGKVFFGVIAIGVGVFFFMFTLGRLRWEQMGQYWPVFLLIASGAFLAQWLVEPNRWGILVPAAISLLIGLIFMPEVRRLLNPSVTDQLIKLWPLALIIAGLAVLAGNMRRTAK
jgi:hypothetical protein